jgi:hypothetical protein
MCCVEIVMRSRLGGSGTMQVEEREMRGFKVVFVRLSGVEGQLTR